jgi:hypothetical protein
MQNKNIQDEEKDGYSDIVDEMQVTTCCSSNHSYRCKGSRLIQYEVRNKCSNSRRHPGYYRRKHQE